MLQCLIDNILVQCGWCIFQRTFGIQQNYAPILADPFFNSNESVYIADLIKKKEHRLAKSFDPSCGYVDDVLSINSNRYGDLIHRICRNETGIMDTTKYYKLSLIS